MDLISQMALHVAKKRLEANLPMYTVQGPDKMARDLVEYYLQAYKVVHERFDEEPAEVK